MTRNEGRWLALGLVMGVGGAVAFFTFYSPRLPARNADSPPSAVSLTGTAAAPEPPDAVELTAEEQKAVEIETVEAVRRTIRKEILASGKVAEPETGLGTISSRVSGRIDHLFLNVTGETVSRGQPVASIYSPEILTSAEEYKLSIENRQRLESSKESQAITEADELVRASRRRLELRGLTGEQIDSIASGNESALQITTYSPVSGVITKRNVAEGQYVKEGDILYTVTDLGTVWVEADIFESDIPLIRNGLPARITAPALGSAVLRGMVGFLQPSVDPQTRTMVARIQVANPQMRLRPGMFVQVSFDTPLGTDVIAVPRSAVLETGKEKIVYVARENGVFDRRSVETSAANDEYYAITRGIAAGERVVTRGNFLIDSQTRIGGALTGMFGGSKAFESNESKYTITFQSDPAPPKGGSQGTFHVMLKGPDGNPVNDAAVVVGLLMPAMPSMGMGEMRSTFPLSWNGSEYVGNGTIAMAGPWTVTVEARRNGALLAVYRSRFDAK